MSKDKDRKKHKEKEKGGEKAARKAAKRAKRDAEAGPADPGGCPGGKDCAEPRAHLCRLAKEGDLAALRGLVRGAAWICAKCGRAARSRENLCRPVEL